MAVSNLVTTTTVDTSKKPKFTYVNRYSWSTQYGASPRGALAYRETDNVLYKLDNSASTSNGVFAKFDLTTNTATTLANLYNVHNPIDIPRLIVHPDGNIYCQPYRNNNSVYSMDYPKYVVSTNTWSTLGGTIPHTYGNNVFLLPKVPSYFTNSTDTVFFGGQYGSVGTSYLINATAAAKYTVSTYDVSSMGGSSQNRYIEIKDGEEDLYPSAYLFMRAPEGSSSYSESNYVALAKPMWSTANLRGGNSTLRMTYTNITGWEKSTTYETSRYFAHGGGIPSDPVCIESRWILGLGSRTGAHILDINTGDYTSTGGFSFIPEAGMTNPVYLSKKKKLYYHGTDNYLYEYDVTFG